MSIKKLEEKKYFSVVYDISRPFDKEYEKLTKKSNPTPEELKILHKKRRQNQVIGSFVSELEQHGVRINWSVFVFPEEKLKTIENILDRYRKLFGYWDIKHDIYILKYAPESSPILYNKVSLHLKMMAEDIVKKMVERNKKEIKYLQEEINHLRKLARVFEISDFNEYVDKLLKKYGVKVSKQKSLLEVLE